MKWIMVFLILLSLILLTGCKKEVKIIEQNSTNLIEEQAVVMDCTQDLSNIKLILDHGNYTSETTFDKICEYIR